MKSIGQIAYEAYRDHTGDKSLATNQPIPEREGLPEIIRNAWEAAAAAVDRQSLRRRLHGWLDRICEAIAKEPLL